MRSAVLICTVLGLTLAKPNNVYHQEYKYKTSSSSFRNNELQHKNDDEGYLSKDGDLEGRTNPIINSHSDHSEYINPRLKNQQQYGGGGFGYGYGGASDTSSLGHLAASSSHSDGLYNSFGGSTQYGRPNLITDNLAASSANHMQGTRGAYYTSDYGLSNLGTSQDYGTSSNLRTIAQQLQSDISRQLQSSNYHQGGYSSYSSSNIAALEEELRRNLTMKLQEALQNQYGQQSIRGGLSYTIDGGRVQSTANYNNQELSDLKRQLESNLLNQLRNQYSSSSSSSSSSNSYRSNSQYSSTTIRPTYNTYDYTTTYRPYNQYTSTTYRPYNQYTSTVRTSYPNVYPSGSGYSSSYSQSQDSQRQVTNTRYTPISNPQSITTIASTVQSNLNTILNRLLDDTQRTYFSTNSQYSTDNYDRVLERLQQDLRSNITYLLDDEIRRNYGNQVQQDGAMFTIGTNGQYSSQSNYNLRDLENLKRQVETNLLEKLNRDFQSHKTRFLQQKSYSSSSSYSSGSNALQNSYGSNSDYGYNVRPTTTYMVPLITSGGVKSSGHQNSYNYLGGASQSGYEVGGSNLADLQRQLQSDLSQQLQSAISRNQYSRSSSYSGSSNSYNPQSYQVSLQQLSDELNRNLTRQLEQASSSSSQYGSSSSSSSGYSSQQLANLRNQLQNDLMKQLTQGLQQSYSSSSSWSSSTGTNYRPVRGFETSNLNGQYKTGGIFETGEDCDQPHTVYKRSVYHTPPSPSAEVNPGYGLRNRHYTSGSQYSSRRYSGQVELGQQQIDDDDSDLTQQLEENSFGNAQTGRLNQQPIDVGQEQVEDEDLTQQEEKPQGGNLHSSRYIVRQHVHLTNPHDSGFTQQQEKFQVGNQQQQLELGQQQLDDSDLKPQVNGGQHRSRYVVMHHMQLSQPQTQETRYYSTSQTRRQPNDLGQQQVDDADLKQRPEEDSFEKLQVGSQTGGQQRVGSLVRRYELLGNNQQQERRVVGNHQYRNPQQTILAPQQIELGQQQVDDSDLTQQQEVNSFEKLQVGSHQHQGQQQVELGQQQIDDSDLGQQQEVNSFEKLQVGNQHQGQQLELGQQQIDDSDLGQQQEVNSFEKLQVGRNPHPINVGQQQLELGQQQLDDSDLNQKQEINSFEKLQVGNQHRNPHQINLGQQQIDDDSDLNQKQEINSFEKLQVGNQNRNPHPNNLIQQQLDDSDLNQKQEVNSFEKFHVGSKPKTQYQAQQQINLAQQQVELGQQQLDDSDLTQQQEVNAFEKLQVGRQQQTPQLILGQQQQIELGQQQIDDSDLTQQQEVNSFEKLQVGDQHDQQQIDLGQKPVEFGQQPIDDAKIQVGSHQNLYKPPGQQQVEFGQHQVDQGNLNQQPDANSFEKLQVVNRPGKLRPFEQLELGQQQVDLSQQVEDQALVGKLQAGNQKVDSSKFLGQEQIELGQEQVEFGGQKPIELGQEEDNSDLTQQVQENPFGNLQTGSQTHRLELGQQQVGFDQQQVAEIDATTPQGNNQQRQKVFGQNQVGTGVVTQQTVERQEPYNGESLSDANREAELLLQTLRQSQQNRQSSSGQTYNQHHYSSSSNSGSYGGGSRYSTRFDDGNTNQKQEEENSQRYTPSSTYGGGRYNTGYGYNPHSSGQQTGSHQLHYGSPTVVVEESVSAVEPLQPQRAYVVEPVEPSYVSHTKGGKVVEPLPNVPAEVEVVDTSKINTEDVTSTEKPGFWKRFGNKVKDGASKLKEKIVG